MADIDWGIKVPSELKPKKKKPIQVSIPPITQSEWEAMEGKAKWDSIVGLRGPDLRYSDTLKFFTTSVIRHRMSGVMRVGGMVNSKLPFVVLPKDPPKDLGQFSTTHFVGHIREAASWLKIPAVHVSSKVWTKMLDGTSNYYEVAARIWQESEDQTVKDAINSMLLNYYGHSAEYVATNLVGAE